MKPRLLALLLSVLCFSLLLAACGRQQEPSPSQTEESSSSSEPAEPIPTLFIGSNAEFQTFPFVGSGELAPNTLLRAMSELTGWNLSHRTEEPYLMEDGSITLFFTDESSVCTGQAEQANEAFLPEQQNDFYFMLFDSIAETLRQNFAADAPEALKLYFCTEDGAEITLQESGVSLPADQPYTHSLLQELLTDTPEHTEEDTTDSVQTEPAE